MLEERLDKNMQIEIQLRKYLIDTILAKRATWMPRIFSNNRGLLELL
jgi:hypothetical protein